MSKRISFLISISLILAILTASLFIKKNLNATIYGIILGRVVAEDTGEGMKGVKVTLFEAKYSGIFGRTVTDKNGYFKVGMVKEGLYTLSFAPQPPYISGTIPDPSPPPLAVHKFQKIPKDIITMGKGNILYFEKILRLGGSISGTVYKKENGLIPLAGASVSTLSKENESKGKETDSEGRYKIEALKPAQDYLVSVSFFGYAMKHIDGIRVEAGKESSGIDFTIDFTDNTGVEGTVTSSVDGKPIRHAYVHVIRENEFVASVRTDEDGKYSVLALEPGIYTLRASIASYEPKSSIKENIYIENGKMTTVDFSIDTSSNNSE